MKLIVGVTSCPTGIAHTYMAAESIEKAAKKAGAKAKVETNGSIGVENKLSDKDIEEAVAVIVAADARVKMKRFDGKPLIEVSVSEAIKNSKKLVEDALDGKFKTYEHK
ncbi:MAG: PTS fructose transporter subunit IIB [Candidatus Izemoplasma sp.]|nr:PTS fructose transporter subunit IIB [Candidatus Izemoplasma sp.]